MSWWPFDDSEEIQTAMLKHLAAQQDNIQNRMEEVMAEFTRLNDSLAKLATDVDAFIATNATLRTENESLRAQVESLTQADATDQANVDAAQAAVDALDARLTA